MRAEAMYIAAALIFLRTIDEKLCICCLLGCG